MSTLKQFKGKPKPKDEGLVSEPLVEEPVEVAKRHRGPSKEAIARRKRFVRQPISRRRYILQADIDDPNMVLKWVDNTHERLSPLLERGYEPVKGVDIKSNHVLTGENVGSVVTKRVGQGKELILVQIPKEWYDADRLEDQREVDAKEAAMHRQNTIEGNYGEGLKTSVIKGGEPTGDLES